MTVPLTGHPWRRRAVAAACVALTILASPPLATGADETAKNDERPGLLSQLVAIAAQTYGAVDETAIAPSLRAAEDVINAPGTQQVVARIGDAASSLATGPGRGAPLLLEPARAGDDRQQSAPGKSRRCRKRDRSLQPQYDDRYHWILRPGSQHGLSAEDAGSGGDPLPLRPPLGTVFGPADFRSGHDTRRGWAAGDARRLLRGDGSVALCPLPDHRHRPSVDRHPGQADTAQLDLGRPLCDAACHLSHRAQLELRSASHSRARILHEVSGLSCDATGAKPRPRWEVGRQIFLNHLREPSSQRVLRPFQPRSSTICLTRFFRSLSGTPPLVSFL